MPRPCRQLLPLTVAVFLLAATSGHGASVPPAPLKALVIYPSPVELDGPRAEQRLGVLGEYADGHHRDLSREAKFRSEAPATATVDPSGTVRPAGDGQT